MIDLFRRPHRAPMIRIGASIAAAVLVAGCASATPVRPAAASAQPTQPVQTPVADNQATASSLAARIDAFLTKPRFDTGHWGISVVSLDTGRVLYAHNADKLAIPASNTKLYTTALALSTLGGNDHITTTLYATAAPRGQTLDGDLILYGRGDPTLGTGSDAHTPTDWADNMASALANRGVTRVSGAIIADDTYFSAPLIPPGWEARDLQTWWSPPASALTVQGNMFAMEINPTDGLCCEITTTPAKPGVHIVNLTQTNPNASRGDLGIYRPPGSRQLYVYGEMRPHARTRRFVLSSPDPARMAGELLLEAMVRHGIRVDGGVKTLHWPRTDEAVGAPDTIAIADVRSPSLADIVHHALKHSDNLYAQLLLLQAGKHVEQTGDCADRAGAPRTTLGWARCGMRAMLKKAGVERQHAIFEEGSGLSHKDLVTPRATTTLLAWASRQPFYSVYREALPVAGVDGTLKHRMRHTAAARNLRAKTGTLRYSYTLSGYVTAASGEHLVFSLMLNEYAQPRNSRGSHTGPSPRNDLDTVAEMLADYGGH